MESPNYGKGGAILKISPWLKKYQVNSRCYLVRAFHYLKMERTNSRCYLVRAFHHLGEMKNPS